MFLVSGRTVKGEVIAQARGVDTRDAADALRGVELYVAREDMPAPDEDEYYLSDLIGLRAVTPEGDDLGQVKSAQNFGAGDLLEIQPAAGASWWLPFTFDCVPEVKLAEGVVVAVRPTLTE